MNLDRRDHWERVYRTNDTKGVSWHQPTAGTSLDLIVSGWPDRATRILDVGGGASLLVDGLLDEGYGDIGVLDIAASALAVSKRRLGARAACVEWYVEDVRQFVSPHAWDVWHDRAV
ncbi:MAG: SAM-dependent methyltransferase, partial [Gemmatimonadota bacterium]